MKYDGENYIIAGKAVNKNNYIINLIIDLFNLKTETKFFVNKIIEYYKNDKFPELQAMWVGDTKRLGYNIRLQISGLFYRLPQNLKLLSSFVRHKMLFPFRKLLYI